MVGGDTLLLIYGLLLLRGARPPAVVPGSERLPAVPAA